MMDKKYKLDEEFLEITFQVPKKKGRLDREEIQKIAGDILKKYPNAVNIVSIPCKMIKEPSRLSVSKDDYSYTTWNSKQESQIIKTK